MDHKMLEFQSRRSNSFDQGSCASSRMPSSSSSFSLRPKIDVDIDFNILSEAEAGDIGDRALYSNRSSESGRMRFSIENVADNGMVECIQEDILMQPFSCLSTPPVSASTSDIVPSLPTEVFNQSPHEEKDAMKEIPWFWEYITCLLSLAVFGILGVLARYGLEKLFGPEMIGATNAESYMYPDLPPNMVGSFFMGWLGVVFKRDISKVSDQLAIGLTTGFLGSLTTFSGWNQKILELSIIDQWVFSVLGIFIGLLLVEGSIVFGIETAKGFKWLYEYTTLRPFFRIQACLLSSASKRSHCIWTVNVLLTLILGILWGVFGYLAKKEFKTGSNEAKLFLACLVAPFGVWIRWFLARLNGKGLGENGTLKWIPFGTLAANILAAWVMAALATLKKEVNTSTCATAASAIQFGFLGCLSTVSTFIAEFHALRHSPAAWRAYAYATMTFLTSYVLGTLIYSVPMWVQGI